MLVRRGSLTCQPLGIEWSRMAASTVPAPALEPPGTSTSPGPTTGTRRTATSSGGRPLYRAAAGPIDLKDERESGTPNHHVAARTPPRDAGRADRHPAARRSGRLHVPARELAQAVQGGPWSRPL